VAGVNRVDFDELEWTVHQQVVTRDGMPFTGEAIERDANGNILAIITYRDGWRDGPEIHYYPNGQLEYEGLWRWPERGVGIHRRWYPNGQLEAEIFYNDKGSLVDVHRYAPDGTRID